MLKETSQDAPLAEELPYWEFVETPMVHAILMDGSLVTGVEVSLRDIECLSEAEINQFTGGLRAALNSVSEGTSLQFVFGVNSDFSRKLEEHRAGRSQLMHPLVQAIAEDRDHRLDEARKSGVLYRPRLSVFVRIPMIETKKAAWFKRKELFSKEAERAYSETLEVLSQNIVGLISSLEAAGLECRPLKKDEVVDQIHRFLNPKRSRSEPTPKLLNIEEPELESDLLEEAPWLASQSPREQLVFGDLVLGYEGFTLDSCAHRVITLKTLPEVTFAGQLSNFLRMPFHYDLVLSIEVPAQASEMGKLQQKRKMAHSLAVTEGGRASDLESESKLSSAEELIRELLNTGQRIYAAQVTVLLRAPATPEGAKALNRQVREVLGRFRGLQGAEGLEETVGAWKIVKGDLPAAPVSLVRARKMKTNNLADFIPVYGPSEGDSNPVVLFRNRLGGLVGYNPFDPGLPNYNCLVTGSSGAGKSFLNNCILLQELAGNLRVFIIDIGGSYRKLTEAFGGQYLEITLSDEYRLNPFDMADPSQEPSSQKIKSLLAIVESMVSEDERAKLPKLDRTLLEKAIIELYRANRVEGKVPTLSDLAAALETSDEPSMIAVSKMLYPWTGDRPYGRLLDGAGSIRTNAPICTFDLKGLSHYPDLQSVMILILTDYILTRVEQNKSSRKRIILDEAWELLKSTAAANFMEYCARTLRKTGSGITFITQGVEEIVASPIGSAILNNTATKFIMLQRGSSEIIRETLKLNEQELALIHSIEQRKGEYSEGFMIEGDTRKVIRVHPGPFEYWLSTSDAQDNLYLGSLREQGMSLVEAIRRAAQEYPNGIGKAGKGGKNETA